MKSFTTIEESRELAKFLPEESADMHYVREYFFEDKQPDWFIELGAPIKSDDIIPCWSSLALIRVLPPIYTGKDGVRYYLTVCKKVLWCMGYESSCEHGYERDLWQYGYEPVNMLYNLIIELHKREIL